MDPMDKMDEMDPANTTPAPPSPSPATRNNTPALYLLRMTHLYRPVGAPYMSIGSP